MTAPTAKQRRDLLVGVRATFGTVALVAPRLALRLLGLDPDRHPPLVYLTRVFAVRDLVLAHQLASATNEDEAEEAIRGGIVVDASDALAALAGGMSGRLPTRAAAMGALGGLIGVCMGLTARSGPDDHALTARSGPDDHALTARSGPDDDALTARSGRAEIAPQIGP